MIEIRRMSYYFQALNIGFAFIRREGSGNVSYEKARIELESVKEILAAEQQRSSKKMERIRVRVSYPLLEDGENYLLLEDGENSDRVYQEV
ncbi:hypothetical protein LIER_19257 [Lithospermum erythrorhizon]|uniref:Uncharacterized protein n=1 Tax=Lithospermum erythrorhizon TaxID=34254 RepID=A0AAV3QI77_LITER